MTLQRKAALAFGPFLVVIILGFITLSAAAVEGGIYEYYFNETHGGNWTSSLTSREFGRLPSQTQTGTRLLRPST